MSYNGISPYLFNNNLTNVQLLDDISASFNGSTTTFNLTVGGAAFHAISARSLIVVLGGIVQKPEVDYTVSSGQITFTIAPVSGLTFAARNIYGLNAINNVNDGAITPTKLSTGGPYWNTSGLVGIGLTNPLGQLHISSGTSGDCRVYIEADTDNNNEGDNPYIIFKNDGGAETASVWCGNADGVNDNSLNLSNSTSVNGGIRFFTNTVDGGWESAPERMRISSQGNVIIGAAAETETASQKLQVTGGAYVSGNVGIGTTNPTQKLDVNGNINLISSGNYIQKTFNDNTEEYILRGPTLSSYHPFITYTRSTGTATRGFLFGTNDNSGNRNDWISIWNGSVGIGTNNFNINSTQRTEYSTTNPPKIMFDTAYSTGQTDAQLKLYLFNSGLTRQGFTSGPNYDIQYHCSGAAADQAKHRFYTDNVLRMTIDDASGAVVKPTQPAFLAYRNSSLSVNTTWQNISSGILTESYDVGPVYSTSTNGRFVAPVAGRYMFYAGGYSVGNTSGERYAFGVKVNNSGSPDFLTGGNYSIGDTPLAPYQIVLNLAANDYVELFFFSAISTSLGGGTHYVYWGGYLLG